MPEKGFIYTTSTSTGPSAGYFSVVNAIEVVTISAEDLAILTRGAQDAVYSWNAPPTVKLAEAIGEALRVLEGAGVEDSEAIVTPEMTEAGRHMLEEELGSGQEAYQILTHAELAVRVFRAMRRIEREAALAKPGPGAVG